MDAPPVQYCKTSDGTNIAWWSLGEGPPLLWLPDRATTHSWNLPGFARWRERLASRYRLISFDNAAYALSDSERVQTTFEQFIDTIGSVADAAGAGRLNLVGDYWSGMFATAFAAAHPKRARSVVSYNTPINGKAMLDEPALLALSRRRVHQ